jgi:hypothetical protein
MLRSASKSSEIVLMPTPWFRRPSAPVYQRTRPGWSPTWSSPAQLLPRPRLWMVLAGVVVAWPITVIPDWDLRPFPCPGGSITAGSCVANGAGHPIAYRFELSIAQRSASGLRWLNVQAPRGIQAGAFAADFVLWASVVLLALYLCWLPNDRTVPSLADRVTTGRDDLPPGKRRAEAAPARPPGSGRTWRSRAQDRRSEPLPP